MSKGFAMGSAGPDGDDEGIPLSQFIPKQVSPEQDLKNKVKLTTEAGIRRVSNIIDVMESETKLDFVIEGILPRTGLMYIGGLSGTGKTILASQLVSDIVCGRSCMTWRLGEAGQDVTALMLSLEMNEIELQGRAENMFGNFPDEDKKILKDRFLTYTEPEPIELWNPVHILDLFKMVRHHGANLLLIDSASVSFASSLKDDAQVNESIKNLYMMRSRLQLTMIIVAHTRKPPAGIVSNPEDVTLNELFGHSGVAQSASSIVIMVEDDKSRKATIKGGTAKKDEKLVHIINAKSRFGANSGAFKAYLTSEEAVEKGEPLMFRRNAIPIAMTDAQRETIKKTKIGGLGAALKGIDFGSGLDDDE